MQAGFLVVVLAGETQVLGDGGVDRRGFAERVELSAPADLTQAVGGLQRGADRVVVIVGDIPTGDVAAPVAEVVIDARQGFSVQVNVIARHAVFAEQAALQVVVVVGRRGSDGFASAPALGIVAVAGDVAAALFDAGQPLVGGVQIGSATGLHRRGQVLQSSTSKTIFLTDLLTVE